jgi:hypothetical protein
MEPFAAAQRPSSCGLSVSIAEKVSELMDAIGAFIDMVLRKLNGGNGPAESAEMELRAVGVSESGESTENIRKIAGVADGETVTISRDDGNDLQVLVEPWTRKLAAKALECGAIGPGRLAAFAMGLCAICGGAFSKIFHREGAVPLTRTLLSVALPPGSEIAATEMQVNASAGMAVPSGPMDSGELISAQIAVGANMATLANGTYSSGSGGQLASYCASIFRCGSSAYRGFAKEVNCIAFSFLKGLAPALRLQVLQNMTPAEIIGMFADNSVNFESLIDDFLLWDGPSKGIVLSIYQGGMHLSLLQLACEINKTPQDKWYGGDPMPAPVRILIAMEELRESELADSVAHAISKAERADAPFHAYAPSLGPLQWITRRIMRNMMYNWFNPKCNSPKIGAPARSWLETAIFGTYGVKRT